VRAFDSLRFDTGMFGNRQQKPLVRDHVVENAGEKLGIGSGLANRVGTDTSCGKELPEALGIACQESERLHGQVFCEIPADTGVFRHQYLPFRNVSPLGFY
jgi:hypothetical protein